MVTFVKRFEVLTVQKNSLVIVRGWGKTEIKSMRYLGAEPCSTLKVIKRILNPIRRWLGKARAAYSKLDKIWKNSQFTYKTKIKIFKANVISVLLYGCECWRMTKTDEKKLDAFLHKSLRRILKIYWPMRIKNEAIKARAGMETISKQVARRRWTWLGHVLRMDHHSHPRTALRPDTRERRKWSLQQSRTSSLRSLLRMA